GGEMPLFKAVDVKRDRSQTTINRTEGQRTVAVTASVDAAVTTSRKIMASLVKNDLPRLLRDYPGLSYSLEGEAKSGNEALESLFNSFYYALAIMYVLIAIPFRSYIQPIVVLSAIPFGFVGAVLGHLYMGHSIGLISLMGILALSGVVVNDSIVLIHTTNRNRETGIDVKESVCLAGIRRFRPIVLTSLTTFLGLTPMIFETSFQAKLLIPMAISLGFGVLFATVIILIIVPAIYVMVEDMKELVLELISDLVRLPKTLGRLFGFRSRIHKPGED
ncbi:MAG: efflux RND transporter permease subunit, partial [Proteobacteria bacterium]|nr:efflux RND transporter permease subunit [Pseudomonadota bacterium]